MERFRFSRKVLDWGVMLGFAGLLCLIVAIGLIGMRQISALNRIAVSLARVDIPLQNAIFEMRISNARYWTAIRSYLSWRNTRYLEAAGIAQSQDAIASASKNFERYLEEYLALAVSREEREWGRTVRSSEEQLRKLGDGIISLVNGLDRLSSNEEKTQSRLVLDRIQREFENKLFWIDAFLENPIQRDILQKLDQKLAVAEEGRRQAVTFLSWSLAVALFFGLATAYLTYRRMKQDQRHREELWRRFVTAQEEERNNLSLQIHDEMGQDLSALKIYLALMEKEAPADWADNKDKIQKAKSILDLLMKKTHNISEILRPPEIDEVGLIQSISGLMVQNKEMTQAHYTSSFPPEEPAISAEEKLVLYRVVQEALTNIAKYSQARNIDVRLRQVQGAIFLTISDDGIGFDLETQRERPMRRKEDKVKLGLEGLRERIELLDGTLQVHSGAGQGTKLEVMLPVH
ncbi:MAG: sensor histidine kinase [Candidatus Omnitrophica bacterium]|nr:sensor histidine kinase [Candidatus Omnitrophota bacterium]